MIPKSINYCWFGHGKKPDSFIQMVSSWKHFCPDYEIVEWNESNYDVAKNPFLQVAYEMKKFAFVSDYARLDIINQNGGIYVDVDVEFLKSIDPIRMKGPFFAMEEIDRVNTGLIFGAEKDDSVLKQLLDMYGQFNKQQAQHSIEYSNTVEIVTDFLQKHGFKLNGHRQKVMNHTIYETQIFCPQQFGETHSVNLDTAYTTHHYNSSWVNGDKMSLEKQYQHARISRTIKKVLGPRFYRMMLSIYSPLFGRGKQ